MKTPLPNTIDLCSLNEAERSRLLKKTRRSRKFGNVPSWLDGHRFDSKAELERYQQHVADPSVVHVDLHPIVTLPGGVRWQLDFAVWTKEGVHFEDVKSPATIKKTDFRNKWKQFNACHPGSPLVVPVKSKEGWEIIR